MPRLYTVEFSNVAIGAVQDLFQIKGAANKVLEIVRHWLACSEYGATPPLGQIIPIRARILAATVTDGTGGTSPTPRPISPGDAAASFSALANNTTQATTSGTAKNLAPRGFHVFQGDEFRYDGDGLEVVSGTSYILELMGAPNGTIHFNGGLTVRERG